MIFLIAFAQWYGTWQALILGSPSRTIRWRILLLAFFAGLVISSPIALLLQLGWTHIYASVTDQPYFIISSLASYTVDPLIEEVVKELPLLIVCLVPVVRRQLGITDIVLICLALGSGFGLAEDLLRYSYQMAPGSFGGNFFLRIPMTMTIILIPGIGTTLGSWVPSGATPLALYGPYQIGTNFHLASSAVNGLAFGLLLYRPRLVKRPSWLKTACLVLVAIVLFSLTVLIHMANNATASRVHGSAFWNGIITVFDQGIEQHLLALFPLTAIVGAVVLDRLTLYRVRDIRQTLLLPDEKQDSLGLFFLAMKHISHPRSFRNLCTFVVRRRTYLFNFSHNPADPSLVHQFHELMQIRLSLEPQRFIIPMKLVARLRSRNTHSAGVATQRAEPDLSIMATMPLSYAVHGSFPSMITSPSDISRLPTFPLLHPAETRSPLVKKLTLILFSLLLLPTLLYFVISSIPSLSRVQIWLTNPVVFALLKFLLLAGLLWQAVLLVKKLKGFPHLLKQSNGQTILIGLFGIMMGVGALLIGVGSDLVSFLSGHKPLDPSISHILSALEASPLLALLALALLATLMALVLLAFDTLMLGMLGVFMRWALVPEVIALGSVATTLVREEAELEDSIVELNERFAQMVSEQNQRLASNLATTIQAYLTPAEYNAAITAPARAYGIALERMVAQAIAADPDLAPNFTYLGGANNPDFVGQGALEGLFFDITTKLGEASHYLRPYGENLVVHTYQRPGSVGF